MSQPKNTQLSASDGVNAPQSNRGRFSFGLVHQAAKGTFSTRKAPKNHRDKREGNTQPKTAADDNKDQDHKESMSSAAAEIVAKTLASETSTEPEALSANRIAQGDGGLFAQTKAKKELLITASAAKRLTHLMAAIAAEPGSGAEIPVDVRSMVLNKLLEQSHSLADLLCQSIMTDGERAPDYLRARLLEESALYMATQWVKGHDIEVSAERIHDMATAAFGGEIEGLTQDIVDLFHLSGEYTPATKQEISQSKITATVVNQSWRMLEIVNSFCINDYDSDAHPNDERKLFSFGQQPEQVARDLVHVALAIAKENELDVMDLDLATSWQQNSIYRACMLVGAEYKMIVDRTLRSAFKDDLHSEAQLGYANSLYEDVLDKIKSRARSSFILIEKNAIDAMSANAYIHYLPKKEAKSNKTLETKKDDGSDTTESMPQSAEQPSSKPSRQTKAKRFSFGA